MVASSTPRRIPLRLRRLHKPYMYKMVFEGGRALRGSPLTLRYFRVEEDHSRIGYIIRKKAGNAPLRNAIRRTLRRSFQEALSSLTEGTWLIFDVNDKAANATRAQLRGEAQRLLLEAGTAAAALPARALETRGAAGTSPRPRLPRRVKGP